ncbi:hypothetical protein N8475_10595 [Winogradskyella sp.]|nr:hypothetical protein [Winogradskyella sp.]
MSLLSFNPYRVLGVLSNSTPRLVQKNLSKIKAFSNIGKSIDLELDLSFLNLATIDRTLESTTKAESHILLDLNKIKYSLFWFQDLSSVDSIALAHLVKGDSQKSLEIWAKLMKSAEVNSKNFSAYNNASTLLLLLQLDNSKADKFKIEEASIVKLKQAIDYKVKLINSNFFEAYCQSLGVKSQINPNEILSYLAETILKTMLQNFTSQQITNFANGINPVFSEIINRNLTEEPILNVKEQLNMASAALERDSEQGLFIGKSLIKNTVSDLRYLKHTLGENHYQYEALADKLSNQILQCGIVFFNKTGDDQSYLSSYTYALSIAPNEKTKTRAKDFIKHCEEEILANICCNCNNAKVDKLNVLNTTMYKETERNWFSNQVKYNQVTLSFCFCKECNRKIDKASTLNLLIGGIGGLIIASLIYANDGGGVGAIFGAIFGFAIINWISTLINTTESDAIKKQPIIRKYTREGFSFTKPGK